MPIRSIVVVAGLALASLLGGCATSVNQAWTAPGWYLERPRLIAAGYPTYLAGPFSYEECEVERLKATRPEFLLCSNRSVKPSETFPPLLPTQSS
jgi:hypothetical protein